MPNNVAIVGAGAMGILTGFHLQLAGADVTYLVRSSRAKSMPAQYRLYSYDDNSVSDFGKFRTITEAAALADSSYDYLVVTLDGYALGSTEGMALLRNMGAAVRQTNAVLIVGSIGVGLRQLAIAQTNMADDRVISGALGLMSHEVSATSVKAYQPTDFAKRASSDFAFRHINGAGFVLEDRIPEIANRFAHLFDQCGIAKCLVLPVEMFAMSMHDIFPVFLAAEIAGWPNATELINQNELWALTTEAVRAIRGLNEHGELGRTAAAQLTEKELAIVWTEMEKAALPLDFGSFNAYHHGKKIKCADLVLLRKLVQNGRFEGRDMSSVEKLIDLL